MKSAHRLQKGTGLVELVIYIAIFSVISVVVVGGTVQETKLLRKARAERAVTSAAETILERIVREIRLACSVSVTTTSISLTTFSDLSAPSGTDCTDASATRVIDFSGGNVLLEPPVGTQLNPYGVTVSNLTFAKVTTPLSAVSDAIAVKLSLSSGAAGSYQVTHTYHATAILRGSYNAKINP